MRTVQMTLDEKLVAEVDRAAASLGTSRSAFARRALRRELDALHIRELERRHREGYARRPIDPEELGGWEDEQVWPE